MYRVKAPAKVNIFLYVTGRRKNGYHELLMLMRSIELHDEMVFEFHQPKTRVRCDHPQVPGDESNLAFKAVTLFYEKLSSVKGGHQKGNPCFFSTNGAGKGGKGKGHDPNGDAMCGIDITIQKNIPVGAGLGGGSSNAAAVLKTMNRFYGFPFSESRLMQFGVEIGYDVPFFIKGGTALAQGLGEKLTPCPVPSDLPGYILLFYPGIGASTAEVYKNMDLALTKPIKFNINSLLKTSVEKSMLDIEGIMHNDLETSTCELYPEIGLFRNELADCVPERVMMTGSGSTFFSLFSDYKKAEHCFSKLSTQWKNTGKKVFLTSFADMERQCS